MRHLPRDRQAARQPARPPLRPPVPPNMRRRVAAAEALLSAMPYQRLGRIGRKRQSRPAASGRARRAARQDNTSLLTAWSFLNM